MPAKGYRSRRAASPSARHFGNKKIKIKKIKKRLDNCAKIVYNFQGYFAAGTPARTNLV
jgi:hypothetical protein